ncbi:TPR-like protein [Aspergillus sclerotioniger CBS 115572]|uniref:TPR-like protein n=1 Tax=Aspergillus sclerotioniger CBS 115572 TaxID=1450535 RepID=A0A317V747_9EURO|nr:TPR-like protein [Aspergillus sclerotioniger CBS 115572]PWY67960.1 TPR-like protein [Aspergillus sclerotioniger CBS 115572]
MTKPPILPNLQPRPLHHPISTTSPTAQEWFNRGLLWTYGFNHEEALRCFQQAAHHDPTCTMAHWGIAYAIGPSYNKQWAFFDPSDLHTSIHTAHAALTTPTSPTATPIETSLKTALLSRFPPPNAIPTPTPKKPSLWDLDTGSPSGPHTTEARSLLEHHLSTPEGHSHPALCHLYIHLMEMTTTPDLALPAANRLRTLMPDASHMLHMPTHIDMAVGDYPQAIKSSQEAIEADDRFFALNQTRIPTGEEGGGGGGALYIAYRVHNIMTKLYCASISGRMGDALSAAGKLEDVIDHRVLGMKSPVMADWTEGFLGMVGHVFVRFGRWGDVLDLHLPGERDEDGVYCCKRANLLYARGIALSALGRVEEAETTREEFEKARDRVPPSRFNNVPVRQREVLAIASAMLEGEVEYRKGNMERAFELLRHGVELEDGLAYCDPPAWTQPVRHALGGLLLEQGRVEEAEQVFREDLGLAEGFPRRKARLDNVWGLHGLYECLVRGGKVEEASRVKVVRDGAMKEADVPIVTSCYCRLGVGCC